MPTQRSGWNGVQLNRRSVLVAGAGALITGVAAACSSSNGGSSSPPSRSGASASVDAPAVTFAPAPGARDVDPLTAVMVTVTGGTLAEVVMTNDDGRLIPGIMTPDRLTWKPDTPLGYNKTYELVATSTDAQGRTADHTSAFTTVAPNNLTQPSLLTTGGGTLSSGRAYGVGLVVAVRFDEPITDRAAAQRALSVQTEPAVEGQWNWIDDQTAHYRPRDYYAPGTAVTVAADVYGVDLGNGLYGQEDVRVSFTIGDAHVSIADDTTKQVSVYANGELVRTMPTSMGRGGTETVNGRTIGENCRNAVIEDEAVIRPYDRPLKEHAGFRVLRGNLFDAAIMKTSVIGEEFRERYLSNPEDPEAFEGRAVVFDGPEDYHHRIDDPALAVDENSILIMRGAGPVGYPGAAEVVNMRPPAYLITEGVSALPCIGDGRQSGTSGSPSILNASPEAAAMGGLALLKDGDRVRMDLKAGKVNVLIPDAELDARRAALVAEGGYRYPASQTPWQEIQRSVVGQLDTGAILEGAEKYQRIAQTMGLPRDTH